MEFTKQLLAWYSENKRDLPWRRTKDPYLVWLSEIIMQQTRIGQGMPYYEEFVRAFPTVRDLAAADEQEVLKLWQGLGYYSRARNLHATARMIAGEYHGKFPDNYPGIRQLKGIGDYTAAAVASICFGLPYAVMDGNVIRFISRMFGISGPVDKAASKKKIHSIATSSIDPCNPGDFNQAMMEFGATVCTPGRPGCPRCIFRQDCYAYKNDLVEKIPVKNSTAGIRHRHIHYLVLTISTGEEKYLYLNKRTGSDIWKNLYDFPGVEQQKQDHQRPDDYFKILIKSASATFRGSSGPHVHLLTHQKLHATFYHYHSFEMIALPFTLVRFADLPKYPVPKLIDRYLLKEIVQPD